MTRNWSDEAPNNPLCSLGRILRIGKNCRNYEGPLALHNPLYTSLLHHRVYIVGSTPTIRSTSSLLYFATKTCPMVYAFAENAFFLIRPDPFFGHGKHISAAITRTVHDPREHKRIIIGVF